MADIPRAVLSYSADGCPDCGRREVAPATLLPALGDDFDWDLRDHDGFRLFMLEELAARFPNRTRWTPADVEVVLAEVLAAQLDKLSDMLDRVAAEQTLATARRPESVRRLLGLIGYDALGLAWRRREAPFEGFARPDLGLPDELPPDAKERLEQDWLDHPDRMDQARLAGPRAIRTQHRMVTLADHAQRLEGPPRHPLVERAFAWSEWSGAWPLVRIAVIATGRRPLDEPADYPDELWQAIDDFHDERGVPLPLRSARPSVRAVLQPFVDAHRMVGQPVELMAAVEVGVVLHLSIQVGANHFQSEVRRAAEQALGTGADGFFRPGRLRFGEDLWASDIIQTLTALDGVDNVCLDRFKRLGDRFPDMASSGRIPLEGLEVAVCDNRADVPERGYFRLALRGGRRG
ncbi:MAG: hypothetical protein KF788_18010 [Piscinibacter sp.]|nr:hypothetical protein [Piscinibacter sp.]